MNKDGLIHSLYMYFIVLDIKYSPPLWVGYGNDWNVYRRKNGDEKLMRSTNFISVDGDCYYLTCGKRPEAAIPFKVFVKDEAL